MADAVLDGKRLRELAEAEKFAAMQAMEEADVMASMSFAPESEE